MSISRVYLCLVFLTFVTSPPVLCSRSSPRLAEPSAAIAKELNNEHIHSPASSSLVSEPTNNAVDSSSSPMTKIDESATKSGIAGFFRYRLPFQGWPFHKYAPFPMGTPANPSVNPTTTTPSSSGSAAEEDESEKVPSSPNKGNRDGGNA